MKSFFLLFVTLLLAPNLFAQQVTSARGLPLADRTFATADGTEVSLGSLAGPKGTVLVFWANKCAWVDRYEARLIELANTYGRQGYSFVLVNSFGPSNAAELAERSVARAREKGYTYPYIIDNDGALAQAIGAKRAPQVFVYGADQSLVYTGAIDDKPSDAAGVSKFYLRDALDATAAGRVPATGESPALGCLISF